MTRNVVADETADRNRGGNPGAYTFHAPLPEGYDGVAFTVACVRLGDHAHLNVDSGNVDSGNAIIDGSWNRATRSKAGDLVLRWHEWLVLRGVLDDAECFHVAEVENPTQGQLAYHVPAPPETMEDGVQSLLDGLAVEGIRELKRLVDAGRAHEHLLGMVRQDAVWARELLEADGYTAGESPYPARALTYLKRIIKRTGGTDE